MSEEVANTEGAAPEPKRADVFGMLRRARSESPAPVPPLPPASDGTTPHPHFRSSTEYRPIRVLDQGGLGRIWLARDHALSRDVAIKELRPDRAEDEAFLARFLREARIHARLQHPNIPPFFHLGMDQSSQPFLVMYRISGATLEAKVQALGADKIDWLAHQLELRNLISLFLRVCDAVAFAHSRGIIHRDLKPANIMTGEYGEVFVLDWGLAKELEATDDGISLAQAVADEPADRRLADIDLTRAGSILGSLAYMAPEQAGSRLDEIGRGADIFGLGGILFYVLTGRPPHEFAGHGVKDFARFVEATPIASARSINRSVPRSLAAIAAKATAMNPADRYGSVIELAADLRRWAADEPVLAYREPRRQQWARWALRHKLAMSAIALAGFTAVLIGVIAQLQRWTNTETHLAEQFHGSHNAVEVVASDLQHETAQMAAQLNFTAGLPGIAPLLDSTVNPRALADSKAIALQVLEGFVQHQPRVLRAAIVNRELKPLAFYRDERRGAKVLSNDGPMMAAASAIIQSHGAAKTGQVAVMPPSRTDAIESDRQPTIIAAAPIRIGGTPDIIGALVMETKIGVAGFREATRGRATSSAGPGDWYYFNTEGRLLYYSSDRSGSLPKERGVVSLPQVFPELAPLLETKVLPASQEVYREQQQSTVVAQRFPIAEFYPVGAPIIVVVRPYSARGSSFGTGYLASAALMIVGLSVALSVVIAWTLVRMVRSG